MRQTHEPTKPNHLKTNPTHRLTRQTVPEPRDAVHASPHVTHHTTHPAIKRGGGDGDGDGAQTWLKRGCESDGIVDGTPPHTWQRGGGGTGTVWVPGMGKRPW